MKPHLARGRCHENLQRGLKVRDKTRRDIVYRYLSPTDDLGVLTAMLHEAYASLAAAGMRFMASYQDVQMTRRRMSRGETIVAVDANCIVGTITREHIEHTQGSPFLDRPDVASFGQFAVRPSHQRSGIGSMLIELAEERARESGVAVLAIDTSEHASELIALYESRGYRFVEYVKWQVTNYRRVVMAKQL